MQYVAEPATVRLYYRGNKYDVPMEFATRMHPGGKSILMRYKDSDITKDFEKMNHSVDAVVMMNEWLVDGHRFDDAAKAAVPVGEDTMLAEQEKKEAEKAKRWNRLAIGFGIASIMAAVQVRKH
ncbi:Cytochrome b5-like Heme/Steroid binding domain containing protein [Novymonas esmeraldas]|uniref:Cytochrome b5-like Heme/Steroid binding domain containing protein n=1 Tax=Novymonas esmeraldas TaxID=1808958 RepID=A0AAW0F2D6_9TRYP